MKREINLDNQTMADEELEHVFGGAGKQIVMTANMQEITCKYCQKNFYANINKIEVKCSKCGKRNRLDG